MLGSLVGVAIGHLINGALLMVAWNAIAAVCGLPTFSYWVCVAVAFTVRWVLRSLAPAVSVADKK